MKETVSQILLATDFSESAARALVYAEYLAVALKASVVILHVNQGPVEGISGERDIETRLLALRDSLGARAVSVSIQRSLGNPGDQILSLARQLNADLIVIGLQGHTHVPGIFTEQVPEDLYQFNSPEEIDSVHELDDRKTLCNVGSVGQPRDGDPRACYILLDGNTIRYRRVEYDIETTIKKIYAVPELENFLGDRLRDVLRHGPGVGIQRRP